MSQGTAAPGTKLEQAAFAHVSISKLQPSHIVSMASYISLMDNMEIVTIGESIYAHLIMMLEILTQFGMQCTSVNICKVEYIATNLDFPADFLQTKPVLKILQLKHPGQQKQCLTKGSAKGSKQKVVGPFSKKDWHDVKATAVFNMRNIWKTPVTRTQGTTLASDGLKGHVFEASFADLQNDEVACRKSKLITEDVQGKNCLTNFHGMDFTSTK
ncbi:hypothetical protein HPG69_016291 [Diceros bicornis minor]|uniref:Uncharacterized protein n=1 Tax=Diceros bicornis minor TaxID=77932 RepID=A0A7J7F6Z8_DICBM|nr:hypothetical protein HPG69_016291 [Diceros bicornis minor]